MRICYQLGGSGGNDASVLAQKFPDLIITVQDMPEVKAAFNASLVKELEVKGCVAHVPHDFYQPQPVRADICLIKLILHEYLDKEAVKILRAVVPALKPGARIIFIEYVGDHGKTSTGELPLPRSIRQMGTTTDLRLVALFNMKMGSVAGWKDVIKAAGERFEIASVKVDPLKFFAANEIVWGG